MTDTSLNKTIFLKAPRQLVWDYLTQPEHLAKWFHAPKSPLAEGETLEMFGVDSGNRLIWGKVITARAPDYLEYTFTVGPMGDAVSTVKWTLTDVSGGTRLSLVHEGLPQGAAAFDLTL
ncbi:MAG: SRPBCC domain-containing protein, partial [Ruegeria sp.]